MEYFLLFLIWIAASFFFPKVLRRLQIPWVNAIILAGIILGPYGFGVVYPGEIMDFLATLGLVFLMFTAGLDTKLSVLKKAGKNVGYFVMLNFAIPFATGFFIGILLRLDVFASLILGTCFSSSSIGVIIVTLRELRARYQHTKKLSETLKKAEHETQHKSFNEAGRRKPSEMRIAEDRNFDLIVMGSQSLRGH